MESATIEKWVMVTFNCSNGWESVTTSIPEREVPKAKQYLEKQKTVNGYFRDIENITFKY